jgi:hypothetical protein
MSTLQEFKDNLAKQIFGKTTTEAVNSGNCIQCNRPALEHCYSEAGKREFRISGLCEECFDGIFKEE